jgi:7-methylguanosine nucleotidase
MNNVFIRNEFDLEKKINLFKKQGKNKIQIISDFDRTLTQAFFNEKSIQTSYSLIREGNYLSKNYPKLAFDLFDKYHHYEISKELTIAEKSKYMIMWWQEHLKIMIEHGLNKSVIVNIVENNKTIYRQGFFEFSKQINDFKIPFLILSAGLGDIIKGSLEKNKSIYSNMKIIANFYDFNNKGNIKGYSSNIIHPFNKNETSIKNTKYFEKIKERNNIILLGDTLEDVEMIKGANCKNLITIGFLNKNNNPKDLHDFSSKYDIIILNDSSMSPVLELFKRMI